MKILNNRKTSAFIAAFLLTLAPALYFSVECELGVPLPFIHQDTGLLNYSAQAKLMNMMFVIHGILYLAGQLLFLRATADEKLLRARIAVPFTYCFGMCLLAAVPGGPLCLEDGSWPLHLLAAFTAVLSGNAIPILTDLAMPANTNRLYRTFSVAVGVTGLIGLLMFIKADFIDNDNSIRGFWQRSGIYATHIWDFVTAFLLLAEALRGDSAGVKQD